jgi:hypothetical protein
MKLRGTEKAEEKANFLSLRGEAAIDMLEILQSVSVIQCRSAPQVVDHGVLVVARRQSLSPRSTENDQMAYSTGLIEQ